tara:strand:- start:5459 stop:7117 length:1659 start_codon:yes stop_codon:yes gene_type:complete
MSSKELIWDTTLYPCDYPKEIKKTFFHLNISNRKKFTKWISNISKNFSENFDWWLSPPASRNPLISDLHKQITILETLNKVKKNFLSIEIVIHSNNFKKILKEWSKKQKIPLTVKLKKKNDYIKNKLIPIKTFIFYSIIFIFIKCFIKKKHIKNNNKIILIDVFQTDFYKNKNFEVLTKNNQIKKKSIYFCPTFVIQRNIFQILRIINSIKNSNYIFKEHYLNIIDFFKCFYPRFFHQSLKRKFVNYSKWDLKSVIKEELSELKDYPSMFLARENYYFCKKISQQEIKIYKSINWFENQTVDKGWNYGFRKFFPKVRLIGYQGFTHYMQFMNTIPAKHEEKAKIISKEILTIGKAYVKMKKEFFPKLNVKVAPALNYQKIFDKYNKTFTNKILIILSGIKEFDKKILDWTFYFLEKNKNQRVMIKAHPILPFENLIENKNSKYMKQIITYEGKLNTILKKTHSVICSGPTSATIESLAFNCYLIIPVLEPCDEENIKNLYIKKNLYSFVYNKYDYNEEIQKIFKKKYKLIKNSKIKNFLFKKIDKKNINIFL